MFLPELASLDLQECSTLPPATLVAPLVVLREIRCALGKTRLNLLAGEQEEVLISSDLFSAFQAWDAIQATDEDDDDQSFRLN